MALSILPLGIVHEFQCTWSKMDIKMVIIAIAVSVQYCANAIDMSDDALRSVWDSGSHSSSWRHSIEVFHTRDQNHVTAGTAPFWGSSFATAAVAAVYLL